MKDNELKKSLELFSHKLKNPLHAIGINMDVVQTKIRKKFPEEKDLIKHLMIVSSESNRLQEIVMKYLKYLELGDEERRKINLRKLLEGK